MFGSHELPLHPQHTLPVARPRCKNHSLPKTRDGILGHAEAMDWMWIFSPFCVAGRAPAPRLASRRQLRRTVLAFAKRRGRGFAADSSCSA